MLDMFTNYTYTVVDYLVIFHILLEYYNIYSSHSCFIKWFILYTVLSDNFNPSKTLWLWHEANENRLKEVMQLFRAEVKSVRNQYLEEMVKIMDSTKASQFWKVVNKYRKNESKSVVQPKRRDYRSLAVSVDEIFDEMRKRYGKESLDAKDSLVQCLEIQK